MLRLLAVFLAFGVPELLGVGARWLIVSTTEMGDGSGPLGSLVTQFDLSGVGERWAGLFLLTTGLVFALEVGLVGWALRRGARRDPPALIVALALTGLLARLASYATNFTLPTRLFDNHPETLSGFMIALNVSSVVGSVLAWGLGLGAFIYLVVVVHARREMPTREGPFREPGEQDGMRVDS